MKTIIQQEKVSHIPIKNSIIQPFRGLRSTPQHVTEVIAPPYDVLSSAEARKRAQNKPWSFLHISKPEIDLSEDINVYDEKVYAQGAKNFLQMLQKKILQQDNKPCYYLYRLIMGKHQQTGLVAIVATQAYQENRVRKHEQTQPAKVADRIKQIQALNAQTGPVLLTYRQQATIQELLQSIVNDKPIFDVTADDKIQHQLWVIDNDKIIDALTTAFEKIDNLYIADGHHRSEAASEIAKINSQKDKQYFLSVIFPDNELQILSYNRVVKDLNGLSTTTFLEKIKSNFDVVEQTGPVQPKTSGQFGMYINSKWFLLTLLPPYLPKNKNKDSLDVALLATYILEPILNIKDPRRDSRIEFVGGIRGLNELEKRVNSGEMAVAFSLYPTQIADVMQVADNLEFMPPKSTWFEPKLADGLVSYLLEKN